MQHDWVNQAIYMNNVGILVTPTLPFSNSFLSAPARHRACAARVHVDASCAGSRSVADGGVIIMFHSSQSTFAYLNVADISDK
jgi:hypothetical protein